MQQIFIPELNMFGFKLNLKINIDKKDLSLFQTSELEKLKQTQIDNENYEVIHSIEKYLKKQ